MPKEARARILINDLLRRSAWRSFDVADGRANIDLQLQARLTEAAKILGLRVLDHVIVTRKGHYSFQEAGRIS